MWVTLHRILIFLGVFAFFTFIVNSTVPFAGKTILEYTAGTQAGRITRLHPLDRVRLVPIIDDQTIAESLIEDPVYFEIKTPVSYRAVRIEIDYRNRAGTRISIGVKRGASFESFSLVPLEDLSSRGIWQRGAADIDLASVARDKNRYRMMIALPGLTSEHPERDVLLSRMRITLERDRISMSDIKKIFASFASLL